MTEEQYCHQMLSELRKSYERDTKPYIDRLVRIASMQTPRGIRLTLDQAQAFMTAKQRGTIAGDGHLCPNDHDPDCRWPECRCRAAAEIGKQGGDKP